MKLPLIKRADGQPSTSVTFCWLTLIISLIYIGLGLIENITIGTSTFKFRSPDPSLILSLLGPAFSLYGWRRFTDLKFNELPTK